MRRDAARTFRLARHVTLVGSVALALLAACDDNTSPFERSPLDEELRALLASRGVTPLPSLPPQRAELVALGQALFFDKILSGSRNMSCATCHHPSSATGDALSISIGAGGVGLGANRQLGTGAFIGRNSQALFNRGFIGQFNLFWDGRVSGLPGGPFFTPAGPRLPPGLDNALAAVAMFPVLSREEMRGVPGTPGNELGNVDDDDMEGVWDALMARLLANPQYVELFRNAFPGVPVSQLRFTHAANALAAFQIARWTKVDAPFDVYVAGNNRAMSEPAKRGALVFFQRGCANCHIGPLFSDNGFANIGVPQIGNGSGASAPLDHGRDLVSNSGFERFRFRTPSLRNVELTGPWMHNGAYTTLDRAVRHYSHIPTSLRLYDPTQLRPELRTLHHADEGLIQDMLVALDPRVAASIPMTEEEIGQVVEFLRALTDPSARDLSRDIPASVPSGLPVDR